MRSSSSTIRDAGQEDILTRSERRLRRSRKMLNATAEGPYPEDVTTPSALSRVWAASLESPVSPALSKVAEYMALGLGQPLVGLQEPTPPRRRSVLSYWLEEMQTQYILDEDTARDELP
ncbi:hypothetical protein CEP54_004557 [Fusarium duplospermum]|uniref:Uncharacterized protein n=1 Tax=Fusarium duplospermum TaxID=1325734 RepID=A0A428QHH7_9HYPO|nr:hypothetical protein CEP54_004557 [Fusarium duplospermum]